MRSSGRLPMKPPPANRNPSNPEYAVGTCLAIGAGLGMLFGMMLGNYALGISAGAVTGLLVGAVVYLQSTHRDRKS